jgi:hypothetical protein
LAFDDKGDNDWNTNDTENDDPQSYTRRGHAIERAAGSGDASHGVGLLKPVASTAVKSILFLML